MMIAPGLIAAPDFINTFLTLRGYFFFKNKFDEFKYPDFNDSFIELIKNAVEKAKSGQVQYKNDKAGIVHAGIGKMNFNENDLLENLKAFFTSISKSKHDTVKGSFIKKVTIASTMGVGLEVNLTSLR